jgi:hypothetical protein
MLTALQDDPRGDRARAGQVAVRRASRDHPHQAR